MSREDHGKFVAGVAVEVGENADFFEEGAGEEVSFIEDEDGLDLVLAGELEDAILEEPADLGAA